MSIIKFTSISFVISIFLFSCAEHIVESTPTVLDSQNQPIIRAKFSSIQKNVFNVSCAISGCHNGVTFPDLSEGKAYNSIINIAGSSGQSLIEPGNAENSYLYLKIIGANGIFGEQMPRGQQPLNQVLIDSIKTWINNGALNN